MHSLFCLLVECHPEERVVGKLPDPDVISSVLSSFLKPLLHTTSFANNISREIEESRVAKAINIKIEELKPYLQDEDASDNNYDLTLETKDEATFKELTSKRDKNGLRENKHMKKYKKLRKKIDKALKMESVTDETHDLILKTLDKLIGKLIESKCIGEKGFSKDRTSKILSNLCLKELDNLRNSYMKKVESRNPRRTQEVASFFDGLRTIFSYLTRDFDALAERYSIRCAYDEPRDRRYQNFAYDSDTDLNRHNCNRFSICSRELRNFLLDFYNFLNDTTVSLVRNYAEMYARDTDNFLEKQSVVAAINGTSRAMEGAIVDIFVGRTNAIRLDEAKNKENNIKVISDYVKGTIVEIRNVVKRLLSNELKAIKDKLSSAISADVNVNLKVDLDNLEREVLGRICFIFKFCNGRYKGRRHADGGFKGADIYVKAEVILDADLKRPLNDNVLKNNLIVDETVTNESVDKKVSNRAHLTFNVTRTTPLEVFINGK
ncbi:unnamed protein product [Leptosia nina]|uniref:Uncharacterized protein n=1 Tax=Leptosia nina TaxID=320188 RepID=A0AAV1JLU4_9NEOP